MSLWFWHASWLHVEPSWECFFLHCFFQVHASASQEDSGFSQAGVCPCYWLLAHVATAFVCLTGFAARLHLFQSIFPAPSLACHCHPLNICNSSLRLLTVSTRFGGVSTTLLSSDSSSLLWELSPHSWWVTILLLIACLGSH
jgi:hypothetical protein